MVKKCGVEKAGKTPASLEMTTFSKADGPQTTEEKEDIFKVPIPGGSGGANVDGNDDTATHCVRDTHCDQVLWKP